MDTPDCNKLGTPVSKFEDSPVFNYINSLSPIKPVKSVHATQVFQSLNFSTIPSIFSSPHLNTNKEFRFLQRHPFSEIVRPDDSLDGENKLHSTSNQTDCEPSCSFEVKSSQLLDDAGRPECFSLDCEDPQFKRSNTDVIEDVALSLIDLGDSFILSPSKDAEVCSGEGVEETCRIDRSEDEVTCDWETLIFDSSIQDESSKRPIGESYEPVNIGRSCDTGDPLSDRNVQDMSEDNIGDVIGDASNENERMDAAMRVPPSCETDFPNLQSGMRRRCLVFDTSGAHPKKFIAGYPVGQSGSGASAADRRIASVNPTTEPVHRVLPGIGLHLNSLAAASKLTIVKQQSMAAGHDPVGTRISSAISIVPLSGQRVVTTSARTSSDVDKVIHKSGSPDGEETSQASENVANEELTDSPKKKRHRAEQAGESRACKPCNCKKSRCLKLYCECFAAGVYCVEQCACQDCFNKPLHEQTVIMTRKQIQSRNPLAFAPKVVRGAENAGESGEASSKTPASARHKRGCNCKKSGCLKKYCECYQVGVGCSESCRCEGCKNAFGRKDANGAIESPLLREGDEVADPSETGAARPVSVTKIPEWHNPDHVLPRTPLHMSRVDQHFSSKGNPPRSSFIRIGSSSGVHISGRFGNPALQPELKCGRGDEMPPMLNGVCSPKNMIKVVSPNKKRVSPPHCESESSPSRRPGRRLILQSIPAFPPLTPQH